MAKEAQQPSGAELYCQTLIEEMKKNPEDHDLWEYLIAKLDQGSVGFPGPTGGSLELFTETLLRLGEIHIPNCSKCITRSGTSEPASKSK